MLLGTMFEAFNCFRVKKVSFFGVISLYLERCYKRRFPFFKTARKCRGVGFDFGKGEYKFTSEERKQF